MAQPDFDLRDFTPYLLAVAGEVASLEFAAVYKARYGMTRSEWRVLFHLGRYGPMTATEIGARARLHKTKISRAVRALELKRFVSRETLEEDRRSERLALRAPGRAAYADLGTAAAAFEARLEARLGAEEARDLRRMLRRLADLD
ncbi:MarR family transcriptional regulator [Limimaricola pyoseonensis]|uniref:DNA-binding transcriptional regulator, MarR family n=1 Tax=Limimaricola pyoseonensis TaxID=521013 RepID=A0A1G7FUM2_9RHOB|nr:MarR family transcriptional regulator [Limimaricola pyoseonensis]SDE79567.1 DNA-binding transcriptional regulator, MarR family [Limimaricola pyoseonensis]